MNALARTTLVLNADFRPLALFPLSRWDAEKAFKKVMKGAVIVVDTYDQPLRSAHSNWDQPSFVALKKYQKIPERVKFNRLNILIRDNFQCQYCGGKLVRKELTFDHVHPQSKGGPTNFDNIVACCVDCNVVKRDRLDIAPRKSPRKPTAVEMARLAPLRRSDVHPSWVSFIEPYGVFTADDLALGDLQRATDEAYWEGELETS